MVWSAAIRTRLVSWKVVSSKHARWCSACLMRISLEDEPRCSPHPQRTLGTYGRRAEVMVSSARCVYTVVAAESARICVTESH